ncbi:MAG: hypothetical protein OIN88_15775 [Candidatus Methanoperedens sp.]|nr:hypothetical protein [Candidatus Methanoperedens sp.]MCZ7360016.1 hypothetical protein [Candidatus Methanoperedens sp.]HLB70218.1 hypothetical protein [Candidatus Methanoperedens sp.]
MERPIVALHLERYEGCVFLVHDIQHFLMDDPELFRGLAQYRWCPYIT